MPRINRGYRTRFAQPTKAKRPECFGDREEYTLTDPTCRQCTWKTRCKLVVIKSKREEKEDREEVPAARRGTVKDPSEFEEREDGGDIGFFGALGINSLLSALGAVMRELAYAIDGIARIPYPDPLKEALERGRKAAKKGIP